MMKVKTLVLVLAGWTVLASCGGKKNSDELYEKLERGQAKISLLVEGRPFYPAESVFKGPIVATDNFFRLNLTDQFESNVIIAFSGADWYAQHPIRRQVLMNNQAVTSVMIGKLTNKAQRQGVGYLMAQGTVEVETVSEEKLVLRIAGKVKRYGEPTKLLTITGFIVCKKPELTVQNVRKADVFY